MVDLQDRLSAEELTRSVVAERKVASEPGMTGKSAIAVEAIVAVVEAVAAMPPVPMRNSEYAVHRADRTADPGADRAAHDSTDRTRRAATFAGAFLRAADNPLRMAEMGYGKQGQDKSRGGKLSFRARVDWQRRCPDLHLHLNSSFDRNCRRDGLTPALPKSCTAVTVMASFAMPLRKIDPDHPIKSGGRLVCARLQVNDP
jgi:hypothetical protein